MRVKLVIPVFILFLVDREQQEALNAVRWISDQTPIEDSMHMKKNADPVEEEVMIGTLRIHLEASDPEVRKLRQLAIPANQNRTIISGNPNESEYFTTYLGTIEFHAETIELIKQFYTVQAAIEKHGHSELILLKKKGAYFYDMEMSDNIPHDMVDGVLRFVRGSDTLPMYIDLCTDQDLVIRELRTN